MSTDVLPVAVVLTVTPTPTTRLVLIRCPVCGRKHTHGWPLGVDVIGTRVAHCVGRHVPPGAPTSYHVPTPPEEPTHDDH